MNLFREGMRVLFVFTVFGGIALLLYVERGCTNMHSKSNAQLCVPVEDCVINAVVRYEIENVEGHKSSDLFFLSIDDHKDPSHKLMTKLLGGSYRVRPISSSIDERSVVRDRVTGEPGVVLSIGKTDFKNEDSALVSLSAYSGFGDAKGYLFELKRIKGDWVVVNRKWTDET
jgi:hypothetical protein